MSEFISAFIYCSIIQFIVSASGGAQISFMIVEGDELYLNFMRFSWDILPELM